MVKVRLLTAAAGADCSRDWKERQHGCTHSFRRAQLTSDTSVCGAGYWVYWFVFLGFIEIKKKKAADSSFMC